MTEITFQGSSDDLVEISGAPGADEFNVNPSGRDGYAGTWVVTGNGVHVLIDAYYGAGKGATWSFMPRMADEGRALGAVISVLSMHDENINEYSTLLKIEVPDDSSPRIYPLDNKNA